MRQPGELPALAGGERRRESGAGLRSDGAGLEPSLPESRYSFWTKQQITATRPYVESNVQWYGLVMGFGSVRLMVGPDDLKGPFQAKRSYESVPTPSQHREYTHHRGKPSIHPNSLANLRPSGGTAASHRAPTERTISFSHLLISNHSLEVQHSPKTEVIDLNGQRTWFYCAYLRSVNLMPSFPPAFVLQSLLNITNDKLNIKRW